MHFKEGSVPGRKTVFRNEVLSSKWNIQVLVLHAAALPPINSRDSALLRHRLRDDADVSGAGRGASAVGPARQEVLVVAVRSR